MDVTIRPAVAADLARINEIYNGYIVDSHISFDLEPWSVERREAWARRYATTGPYRIFVADTAERVIGVAYSSPYRMKDAYRTSIESTVVVDPAFIGRGIGRRLLTALLKALAQTAVHRAYAVIALPNDASVALHESLGYRRVGTFDEVGFKLGRYWSTTILEKRIDGPRSDREARGVR